MSLVQINGKWHIAKKIFPTPFEKAISHIINQDLSDKPYLVSVDKLNPNRFVINTKVVKPNHPRFKFSMPFKVLVCPGKEPEQRPMVNVYDVQDQELANSFTAKFIGLPLGELAHTLLNPNYSLK